MSDKFTIGDGIVIGGLGITAIGLGMIYPPIGVIAIGAALVFIGLAASKK